MPSGPVQGGKIGKKKNEAEGRKDDGENGRPDMRREAA